LDILISPRLKQAGFGKLQLLKSQGGFIPFYLEVQMSNDKNFVSSFHGKENDFLSEKLNFLENDMFG